jgi:hypothetical protein
MPKVNNLSKSITPEKGEVLGKPKGGINPKLEKFIKEECKMVKGRFKNYEVPGGGLPFEAGKYPGQPLFKCNFQDGEVYEVPLWVARHLNGIDVTADALGGKIGSCSYPIHGFKWEGGKPAPESVLGAGGSPIPATVVSKRKQRFGFEPLDFSVDS